MNLDALEWIRRYHVSEYDLFYFMSFCGLSIQAISALEIATHSLHLAQEKVTKKANSNGFLALGRRGNFHIN